MINWSPLELPADLVFNIYTFGHDSDNILQVNVRDDQNIPFKNVYKKKKRKKFPLTGK